MEQPVFDAALKKLRGKSESTRLLIAVAGAPASGKSTFAKVLKAQFEEAGVPAVIVPMDGFHLDNRLLDELGLRERKGAPETFDLGGFTALIQRLQAGEDSVYLPVFDRRRDIAIAGARRMTSDSEVLIVEGNYLLFDELGWRDLRPLWDMSIWIETPERLVRDRCIQRWLDHGHDQDAARERAESNDIRNARRVTARRLEADMTINEW
jgi:fructokinase